MFMYTLSCGEDIVRLTGQDKYTLTGQPEFTEHMPTDQISVHRF